MEYDDQISSIVRELSEHPGMLASYFFIFSFQSKGGTNGQFPPLLFLIGIIDGRGYMLDLEPARQVMYKSILIIVGLGIVIIVAKAYIKKFERWYRRRK